MPLIGRVSSATMHDLGAYDTREQRLHNIFKQRDRPTFTLKRLSLGRRSLPTSLERRMPGAEHYDGFTMKKRGKARGKKRKTRRTRRNKKTRRNKRKKRH